MKYFLGLDNGGTTTKAAIIDQTGKEIAIVSMDTATFSPEPGFIERDMEEMWQANCHCIREVLKKAGIRGDEVRGVAVCGHGKGLYLWGQNGKPVRNGILSTDNRAWRYPRQWQQDGTEEKVFAISCQHILSSQSVSILAWLRDNEVSAIPNTKWIFACKDYIRFRLTGEAYAERTDYSGCNLLNLHTGSYDAELLALFGLEECMEKLPPLKNATDICGCISEETAALTGLSAGTPVSGGAFDIDACALAVGICDEEHLCAIAGTWSINEYIRKAAVTDGSVLMNSLYCMPGYYLVEESSPTSAGNSAWFARTLLPELKKECAQTGDNVYERMNQLVEEVPAEEFVPVFLPFLMGSNVHPNAMGSFVGLSSYHTRGHVLRGLYEGICYCHKYHIDKLLRTKSEPFRAIRLAGGAARSPMWTQMFADVTGIPVESVKVNETGAFGCAMISAVTSGTYPDLQTAAAKMCSISQPFIPDPERHALYLEKYELYQKTIEALDGVWDSYQAYRDRHYRR